MTKIRWGELLTPFVVLLYALIYYSQIYKAPLKAGGWPKALLLLCVLLSAPIIFSACRGKCGDERAERISVSRYLARFAREQKNVLVLVGSLFLYCLVVPHLGFMLSTFLFMFMNGWYLGRGKPLTPFLVAAGFSVFVYAVCVSLLNMQMPTLFS